MPIIFHPEPEYLALLKEHFPAGQWYNLLGFKPRGFEIGDETHINESAWFLSQDDYTLLLAHEQGHAEGKNHTLTGVMSDNGFIRYVSTSWRPWGLGVVVFGILSTRVL